jgi:hypothetical protein
MSAHLMISTGVHRGPARKLAPRCLSAPCSEQAGHSSPKATGKGHFGGSCSSQCGWPRRPLSHKTIGFDPARGSLVLPQPCAYASKPFWRAGWFRWSYPFSYWDRVGRVPGHAFAWRRSCFRGQFWNQLSTPPPNVRATSSSHLLTCAYGRGGYTDKRWSRTAVSGRHVGATIDRHPTPRYVDSAQRSASWHYFLCWQSALLALVLCSNFNPSAIRSRTAELD